MFEATAAGPVPAGSAGQDWQPTSRLQCWLLFGVVAVLSGACLSAVATLLELLHGEATGFTAAMALELASLVPQVLVLGVFLALAQEVDSTGLKRSSVGFFASAALMQLLFLADAAILPAWAIIVVGLTVLVGTWLMMGYVFGSFTSAKDRFPSNWVFFSPFGILFVLFVIGRRMFTERFREWILMILGLLLLLSTVAFLIWFAVSLIRLRSKLGFIAAVLGGWLVVGLVLSSGGFAWCVIDFEDAPWDSPHWPLLMVGAIVETLLTALLAALLFLSVRNRAILARN